MGGRPHACSPLPVIRSSAGICGHLSPHRGDCPLQVGALAACRVDAKKKAGCDSPCRYEACGAAQCPYDSIKVVCRCPDGSISGTGRRLAAAASAEVSPWREGAVDVLSVACSPGSASRLCESEEGVMDALHDKVSGQ